MLAGCDRFSGPWRVGVDFFRLDGKTPKSMRHSMIKKFNNPNNTSIKCFLISSKAGGQGINLIGANRVILLDTSWNPSNDQQNIFRVFRLEHKNKCYIQHCAKRLHRRACCCAVVPPTSVSISTTGTLIYISVSFLSL